MSDIFRKIRLLLWKNCLIQLNHWFQLTIDIFLPVLLFVFFAYLYTEFSSKTVKDVVYKSYPIHWMPHG